jgi:hypothetical protein
VKLEIGGRYRLRNGALVGITGFLSIPFKDGRTGKPATYDLAHGRVVGTTGEKLSWQRDTGGYSAVGQPHPLDIVRRIKS